MKRTVRKANELPTELSPITPSGQVVWSTIKQFYDPANPTVPYVEEFTPNAEDAITVLNFLNNMNGIGWTSELKRIEAELRNALHDLLGVK